MVKSTSVVVVACERLLVAAQLQQVQKETLDVVVERALKLLEQTAACELDQRANRFESCC